MFFFTPQDQEPGGNILTPHNKEPDKNIVTPPDQEPGRKYLDSARSGPRAT